jgi:GAF domain-containing protein
VADSPLTSSVAELSRFFVGGRTVVETLQRVVELTLVSVTPTDMAGITMIVEGRQRTAVYTDDQAPDIDRAQYDSGDGPCVAAFRTGTVTEIRSTSEPGEWMAFRQTAADYGIGSTLSLPLLVDTSSLGALNLYSKAERAFSAEDRETGGLFAAQAAIVLANSQAYWDAQELGIRLGEAMKNRSVIEQAKGILIGAEGIDENEAFEILVRASQRENIKLRDIARRIVDHAQNGRASRDGTHGNGAVDGR